MSPILGIVASQNYVRIPTTGFVSIATTTVGAGGASTITFSGIPQVYKHLQIRAIASGAGAQRYGVQFNGDTGANYTQHFLYGTGSGTTGSGAATGGAKYNSIGASDGGSTFGASVTDILDYTNTNKNTVVRSLAGYNTNTSNGLAVLYSFVWLNTAAVTSLTIQAAESYSGNFAQYSQFALYGIQG